MIRKLLLLFILLSSFFVAFSQDTKKAFDYFNAGKYELAAVEFESVLPKVENMYGITDTNNYSLVLLYTAVSFERSQQFIKAETYYYKAKKVYEAYNAINSYTFSVVLNNLAGLYFVTGKYEKAEPLYIQVEQIRKKALGEDQPSYAISLNNLAELYREMGKFERAESLYLQASQILKKVLGEEHPSYITSLNNLALLYDAMGKYEKAEPLYIQALQFRKKVLGEEHADYATSLNNLAELYKTLGNFEKAEPLYIQALQILKKVLGDEHPDYATVLNNLATLYYAVGDCEKAETYFLQSMQIRKRVLGEEHPQYATILNNLAEFYQTMGNFEKAEQLYLKTLQILKNAMGFDHPRYATTLNNLAGLYRATGNYKKAEPLYLQALQIRKKVLGDEHLDYATSLNNLAGLYKSMSNYEKAEPLYLQALQIRKKVLGDEHPDYASTLNNLAGLYESMSNYEKAEPLYLQALQIINKSGGEEYSGYVTYLNNLALLYLYMGNYEKSESFIIKAISAILSKIKQQSVFLSEIELATYLKTVVDNFKFSQSLFLQRKTISPALTGESYNIELTTKGLLLNSGMQMRQNILKAGDTAIIRTYNDWVAIKVALAKQYTLPIAKRTQDTKTLEEEANAIEKQLTRSSSIFAHGQQLIKTNWKDIQSTLKDNETAIEFSSFQYYDGKRWTDSTYYVALVLRKNDEYPQMIYLCEEKQLDSILKKTEGDNIQKTNQLYASRGIIINDSAQSLPLASRLYELVWKPIEPLLKDVSSIYFSPSGLLHKISFSAIATPDSICLLDKYKLVQLGSTAEIVGSEKEDRYITVSDTAFLCGGINYDHMKTDKGIEEEKELFVYNRGPQISNDSTRSISWRYLPGTYKEAKYIDSLFRKNKISTTFYSDSNATETMFKNLSDKAPQIIHVSTHGFFFPEPKKEKPKDAFLKMGEETYRFSENPLLRSGLIMAGANYVWKGGEQTPGQDDGILTAYEVSNMNLFNTKLVVLSACETGLGDIKGSEGVFGLQRALKMAGVDYIIMSLWKVPDKETTEFMKLFYSNCLSNHSIRESFYLSQTTMRKKYDPYYWAAFVLME